ncbi:MAG: preprotein translocase subunit YajC [Microbacteriaceae bacterium]
MDPLSIAMFAILAVLIFFMFRNSQTRKKQQEELKSQIVPGVEVMTNFGLFGTLVSVDEFSNVAELETSPGNIVRVHRQTISKVVPVTDDDAPRSVEEAMERANREAAEKEAALNTDTAIRHDGSENSVESKKPARRIAKKASE